MERYFEKVQSIIKQVILTQADMMHKASERCAKVLLANKQLFFFGTGHSHMLAEEAYYRAGGFKQVKPILETALMLHESAVKSTRMERMEGYADILLDEHKVGQDDLIFIISNSGLNAVPVEMAFGAKARGAAVIAITNVKHSMSAAPRHSSGKKLYEIADIVLDNCGDRGDASVRLENVGVAVGPTSSVIGAFIINSVMVQVADNIARQGLVPQVYVSANVEEGDTHNAKLAEND
ncbi:SIS domain-containing protein [Paenibacillus allorhizosphaerae]|uniref:SIS domain-containing protein n=1 Tax=Paenibacillus allorhizosphaerae TaxID=2849866 RepID=A0ABM8VPB4_9BACL|nr:SIS domain-containing protein [Paenibacillus allorhizosphaerae]CAG7652690.1 hypothetical protein PAECIP111802_05302 [Paenibacillus allorhizosphaerae]